VHARTHDVPTSRSAPADVDDQHEKTTEAQALAADAHALVASNDVLELLRADLRKRRFAGDSRNVELLYLALTSRLLDHPVSVLVKGPAGAGKNATLEQALRYIPTDGYIARSYVSAKALFYASESFKHKMLVFSEGHALAEGEMAGIVRTLLSEGRLVYEVTDRDNRTTETLTQEGPTGLITTTTLGALESELETRCLSTTVLDTAEQTRAVLLAIADGETTRSTPSEVDPAWHAFQEHVAALDNRVRVPFAPALADLVDPRAVRMRRDFQKILSLVKAHALLHQANRSRDEEGVLLAEIDHDYQAVYRLTHTLFAEAVERTVSRETRETVIAVRDLLADGKVTTARLASALQIDPSSARRRLDRAIDQGFVINAARRGAPRLLTLGEALPDDAAVLPTPQSLKEACMHARAMGADDDGSESATS
jgi:hypothetical protein